MVINSENEVANRAMALLRAATAGTKYEGRLYLVGGALRDRYLHVPHGADLDLVLEGDAVELARMLFGKGLSSHYPVLYPRFGTAMIHLVIDRCGVDVELVTARSESYHPDSRKPDVRQGTLKQDIFRRDFTINTLAENLHTSELLDITGRAFQDLDARIIRTPVDPQVTFFDDPLRMLRAVRLAARFHFRIETETWSAIQAESGRLRPPTIALERIRDEFIKIAMLPGERQFRLGVELLLESGLLAEFIPEMVHMAADLRRNNGKDGGDSRWISTLLALESLPDDAQLEVRLALLLYDIGDSSGQLAQRANVARSVMNRLKFANNQIHTTVELVRDQERLTEYRPDWDDSAVKRLIRDIYPILDQLFTLTACIESAAPTVESESHDLNRLRERIGSLISVVDVDSPLDGNEIMKILGLGPGKYLKGAKDHLLNAVIDGHLERADRDGAAAMLLEWWQSRNESH